MTAGLRLWVGQLPTLLPLALLASLPGEGLRLLLLLRPAAPPWQQGGVALALILSLLGTGFLTAAMMAQVVDPLTLGWALWRGLGRMMAVARTQLLLLLVLGVPFGLLLLRVVHRVTPLRLAPCLLAAVLAAYLGLRASLAVTAAAADGVGGVAAVQRSLHLTQRHLEDLLTFGLLVTAWMLPLLVLLVASTLLIQPQCFWLAYGLGLFLNFLVTLQGQGAAVGLALLYADACVHIGTPTRLQHLAANDA